MQLSNEIITILEYLCDKLGIAVDWSSKNVIPYVQELSIRVLENYCTVESYQALCSIKKQEPWLQNYIDSIKKDFSKRLCL